MYFFIAFVIEINIFLLLLSIDNISHAYNFLVNNYNQRLTYKDIVDINNKIYLAPIFERYCFYGLITLTYYLFDLLVIENYIIFVKFLLSIIAFPYINNKIYERYVDIFEKIRLEKNKIIKLIFCKQIYKIIEKLNYEYVDNEIILYKNEIIDLLMVTNNFNNEIITFTKNIIIVLLLNYFKTKSIIYYKLTKYIYMINSGKNYINKINLDDAKENFIDIFKNKNYKKINDPMIIHSMLYLYYNKKSSIDWNLYRQQIDYKLISFATLWTIGSFFDGYYKLVVMTLSSVIIGLTRKENNIYNLGLIICAFLISKNTIFMSFLYHYGYYLVDNFIVKGIQKSIQKSIKQLFYNNYKQIIKCCIQNILISYFMKYLFIYNYLLELNIFVLLITNFNSNIFEKILYSLIYIAIINKKILIKILLLSCFGSVIIELTRIKNDKNDKNDKIYDIADNIIRFDTIENEIKDAIKDAMNN
jgi:hypothetical protein